MEANINTIKNLYSKSEIEIKKSKFIGEVFYCESEEHAKEILEKVRDENKGARHVCYGYRILENGEILREKQSDDGEPKDTAGMVILNILKSKNLKDVLVTVTRYFGGILLGTGGLSRAYSEVALEGIKNNEIILKEKGLEIEAILKGYENKKEFEYFCKVNNIKIVNINYLQNINYKLELTFNCFEKNKDNFKNLGIEKIEIKKQKYVEI